MFRNRRRDHGDAAVLTQLVVNVLARRSRADPGQLRLHPPARSSHLKASSYSAGRAALGPHRLMDNLRRFPAPWVMEEDAHGFRVKDANGFLICAVSHRDDLHSGITSTPRTISHGMRRGE